MISVQYDDYSIEPYEIRRGTWRSRLRRWDGQMIEAAPEYVDFPLYQWNLTALLPRELSRSRRSLLIGALRLAPCDDRYRHAPNPAAVSDDRGWILAAVIQSTG